MEAIMSKKPLLVLTWICLSLVSARSLACDMHMAFNPDEMGFFGGAVARMSGLAPPKPAFELEHPALSRATIGETNEIVVNYTRPIFSKNVSLKLTGTRNIQLSQDVIELDERSGSVSFSYQLADSGYDSITLTVSGEHKGETVRVVRRIYVRANKASPTADQQVSSR